MGTTDESIAWANEKARVDPPRGSGTVEFVQRSATDVAWLPENYFAFVLDGFLLHCLIGSDPHAYLREIHRVLDDGGIFFVQSFCADDLDAPAWCDWNIDPQTRYRFDDSGRADKYVGMSESILCDLRSAGSRLSSTG